MVFIHFCILQNIVLCSYKDSILVAPICHPNPLPFELDKSKSKKIIDWFKTKK